MTYKTPNFLHDIIDALAANSENPAYVEAVIITMPLADYLINSDGREVAGDKLVGKRLTWEKAAEVLNYEYDTGFGAQDCHSVLVYTRHNIYYVHEYDGSTNIKYMPRNPTHWIYD